MLKNINKILTGDLLKALCDMGHGDDVVIADANFPGAAIAKRLIRLPGVNATQAAEAVLSVLPIDTYSDDPVCIMEMTDGDKKKGMPEPAIYKEFGQLCGRLGRLERFAFYERTKGAYLVIQTGEERLYGNLLIKKGVVV